MSAPRAPGGPSAARAILFDLDGTLVDSRQDLATAVNRVRGELGAAALSLAAVSGMVGEGARILLERALPALAPAAFEAAFASFLRHYDAVCLDTTTLYPGLADLLRDAAARAHLAVVTNKPESMARKILEHLGVRGCFAVIVGGDTLSVRKPDPEVVRATAATLGLASAEVVLVGDSLIDAATAEASGCGLCLVTWGFRPRAELAAGYSDALCDTATELRARLALEPTPSDPLTS